MKPCERCQLPIADNTKPIIKFDLKTRKLCKDCKDKFRAWFARPGKVNSFAEYGGGQVSSKLGKQKIKIKCPYCNNENVYTFIDIRRNRNKKYKCLLCYRKFD